MKGGVELPEGERVTIELRPIPKGGVKVTISHPSLSSLAYVSVETDWPTAMGRAIGMLSDFARQRDGKLFDAG